MKKYQVTRKLQVNEYGNINIRNGLPNGTSHIPRAKYAPIVVNNVCGNMGVEFARALSGFKLVNGKPKPIIDGIVVWSEDLQRIEAEVEHWRDGRKRKCKFDKVYMAKNEALGDALDAVVNLNVHFKRRSCSRSELGEIKNLKKRFVLYLYEMGFCENIGLYRPHNIVTAMGSEFSMHDVLVFAFKIDGKEYCLHHPRNEFENGSFQIEEDAENVAEETTVDFLPERNRKMPLKMAKALIKWVLKDKGNKSDAA